MMALPRVITPGSVVTAKRAGWDETLSPWRYMDVEPVSEKGYGSVDLEGVLEVTTGHVPGVGRVDVHLVGGQEADPKTIRLLDDSTDNAFCPTGQGGGVDSSCSPGGQGPVHQSPHVWWAELTTKEKAGVGVPKKSQRMSVTAMPQKDADKVVAAHKEALAKSTQVPTPPQPVKEPVTKDATPPPSPGQSQVTAKPQWPKDDFVRGEDLGVDLHQKLQPAFKPLLGKLGKRFEDAVEGYTGEYHKHVNNDLRQGRVPKNAGLKEIVDGLDEGFSNSGRMSRPVLTYRSISLPKGDAERFYREAESKGKDGTPLQLKGFTSTTVDPSQTGAFEGKNPPGGPDRPVHFEIQARHGIYVDDISTGRGERELLLPRDGHYKVSGVKRGVPYAWGGTTIHRDVIQLEQVVNEKGFAV